MSTAPLKVILSEKERNRLVEKYAYLVEQMVKAVHPRFPSNVEKDDLFSYGVLGLIDAINKFDASKGVKFETYASSRIYGAMIDELRRYDWVPRSVRSKQKKVEKAMQKLACGQQEINLQSISDDTGLSQERLLKLRQELNRATTQSMDETLRHDGEDSDSTFGSLLADEETLNPVREMQMETRRDILKQGLATLSTNERQIVEAIYFEETNLRTLSHRLQLSISRISQLHRRALGKLEAAFTPHYELMVG